MKKPTPHSPLDPPFIRGNCCDSKRLRRLLIGFRGKSLYLSAFLRGNIVVVSQ